MVSWIGAVSKLLYATVSGLSAGVWERTDQLLTSTYGAAVTSKQRDANPKENLLYGPSKSFYPSGYSLQTP
jgi:hypothetical protein